MQLLKFEIYNCRICRMINAIREAIHGAGGPSKVARELNVSPQAVCFWRDGKRQLPAEVCPVLERLNEGRVRCEAMRPDVDWAYLRNTPSAAPAPAPAQEPGHA